MSNAFSKESQTVTSEAPHSAPVPAHQTIKWGPLAAIVVSVLVFVISFFVAALIMFAIPSALNMSASQADQWLSSVGGQFVFVLLAEGLTILGLIIFLRRRGTGLHALGFARSPAWTDIAYAFAGFGVYLVLVVVASAAAKAIFHIDLEQKQELGFDVVATHWDKIMAFISLVVLPPLVEETMFRGFLFTGLRKSAPFVVTALVVSALFASLHLIESSQGLLWAAGIDTFVLSLVLCYLREKTGNLWASIGVHAMKNLLAFYFLYIVVK